MPEAGSPRWYAVRACELEEEVRRLKGEVARLHGVIRASSEKEEVRSSWVPVS